MANYWFHIIPIGSCDDTIQKTLRFYRDKKRYKAIVELQPAPAMPNLSRVAPGDVVFVCAHGHESQDIVTSKKERSAFGCITLNFAQILNAFTNLPAGTAAQPISIKLLVCWAGGMSLTDPFLKKMYNHDRDNVWRVKYESKEYLNWVNKLPSTTLAKKLAIGIKNHGTPHIYVGGYPGELTAHKRKEKSVGVPIGDTSFPAYFEHSAIWFDGNGRLYQRMKDIEYSDRYRFREYKGA